MTFLGPLFSSALYLMAHVEAISILLFGMARLSGEESPFGPPVHFFNRFGQDPRGFQEDRFQGRERAGRHHSGHGPKAFARLQHDPCPLVGPSAGI